MGRPGLMRHRKFARLQRLLSSYPNSKFIARGVLEVVWESAYENGDELLGDELDLEALVGWEGEPKALSGALVQAGFVDETVEGLTVHDLWDHAPDYVKRRAEREGERRKKGQSISEIRAEAGRLGGLAKAGKRNSLATPDPSKTVANVSTRAPAPAPAQKDFSVAVAPEASTVTKRDDSVTDRHAPSQTVTPSLAVPSLAELTASPAAPVATTSPKQEQPQPQKPKPPPKPRTPSAQEQIVRSLDAARALAHPGLTAWPLAEARSVKLANKVFATGTEIRTAHDADPKLFAAAFARYLADPYWKTNGGWPLTGFLAKWREHLDSIRATQPSSLFKNAARPGERIIDPYAEEETAHG